MARTAVTGDAERVAYGIRHELTPLPDGRCQVTLDALAISVVADSEGEALHEYRLAFAAALNALPDDERDRWVKATMMAVPLDTDGRPIRPD